MGMDAIWKRSTAKIKLTNTANGQTWSSARQLSGLQMCARVVSCGGCAQMVRRRWPSSILIGLDGRWLVMLNARLSGFDVSWCRPRISETPKQGLNVDMLKALWIPLKHMVKHTQMSGGMWKFVRCLFCRCWKPLDQILAHLPCSAFVPQGSRKIFGRWVRCFFVEAMLVQGVYTLSWGEIQKAPCNQLVWWIVFLSGDAEICWPKLIQHDFKYWVWRWGQWIWIMNYLLLET